MSNDMYHNLIRNRWIKYSIQIIILSFCVLFIIHNVRQINLQIVDMDILKLIWSLIFIMVGGILGAISWWLSLRIFDFKVNILNVSKIQFKSNLVKYIPGYAWQLLGKGILTANQGIPKEIIGVIIIFEYILIIISGASLAGLIFPIEFVSKFSPFQIPLKFVIYLRLGSLVVLFVIPLFFNKLFKMLPKLYAINKFDIRKSYFLIILMIITWIINSVGFDFLIQALSKTNISIVPIIFTLTTIFIVGLLIVIIPGSLGIRESLIILMLGPTLGNNIAGLVAIVFRMITILSELLLFVIIILWSHKLRIKVNNNPKVLLP